MKPAHASPSKSLPKELPGFDVGAAVGRMFDNPDLWWRALAIFHVHYAHWEDAWRQAQTTQDAERKCVHALRSSAANIGADRLAAAAAALEKALEGALPPPAELPALRDRLQACLAEARQSVRDALNTSAAGTTEP